MLLILAIALLIAWFLAFVAFHVLNATIHILLGVAIVFFIWHLITTGRRSRMA